MKRTIALLVAVLLCASLGAAWATGTLSIPVVFGSLTAVQQNLSLFDTTFNAIRDYINNREITIDVCANRPAAGTKGRYYFCTDTSVYYADTGVAWQQISTSTTYTNELTGLTTATVSQVNQITVAAGAAASNDATVSSRVLMTLASATQGNTAGTWVVGNFQNKLDAGALGASQTWHIYVIQRVDTGNVDILYSQSATAPTMPTNYTKRRAIGAFLTDAASNLIGYVQNQDEFYYVVPPANDVSGNHGTTAFTASSTTPNGVRTQAILHGESDSTSTVVSGFYVSSLDQVDVAPSATATPLMSILSGSSTTAGTWSGGGQMRVWTDTARSYRVRQVSTAGTAFIRIATIGFVYPRRP